MTDHVFTPNELIHLLLDGEATAAEREQVFAALANDTDLQTEFDGALKLRNAFEEELRSAKPSPMVTASLFEKAGIATFSAGGAAVLTGAAVTTAVKTGWFASAAKFLSPIIYAAVGSVATYTLMQSSDTEAELPVQSAVVRTVDNAASSGTAAMTTDETTQSGAIQNKTIEAAYANVPVLIVHDTVYMPAQTQSSADNTASTEMAVTETPEDKLNITDEESVYANDASENNADIGIGESDSKTLDEIQTLPVQEKKSSFTVNLRSNMALRLYPDREMSSGQNAVLNNISGGMMFEVSPGHSLGVEVGQETFPMNVVSPNGSVEKKYNLFWGGVAYRYMMQPITILAGLSPYAQAVLGGTISGPMGKLALGIAWEPDSRVILMTGVEGMVQGYEYQKNIKYGEKLGVSSGIAIRF